MAEFYTGYLSYEDLKAIDVKTSQTGDDTIMRRLVDDAGRIFERLARGRKFYPRIETRRYDHPKGNASVLKLDDDLLELNALTTQNGATAVLSSQYYLMCGDSYDLTPYNRIVLKSDSAVPVFLASGTAQQANAVTGFWGYHERYAEAWQLANDSVQNGGGMDATTTSLTVNDADGADTVGITPRFKVGHLIKIDSEMLYVTAKNTTTNVLTVRRGVNGSTAAAHNNGALIYIWVAMFEVAQPIRRLAAYLYRQKDTSRTDVDRAIVTQGGVILPADFPNDVMKAAQAFARYS